MGGSMPNADGHVAGAKHPLQSQRHQSSGSPGAPRSPMPNAVLAFRRRGGPPNRLRPVVRCPAGRGVGSAHPPPPRDRGNLLAPLQPDPGPERQIRRGRPPQTTHSYPLRRVHMISSATCKHPKGTVPALDPENIVKGLEDLVPGPPLPRHVSVPDVVGLKVSVASTTLAREGLRVVTHMAVTSPPAVE